MLAHVYVLTCIIIQSGYIVIQNSLIKLEKNPNNHFQNSFLPDKKHI